jgi:WXXGXW repeat (2 copies)
MRIARLIFSALLLLGISAIPSATRAQVGIGVSIRVGPPVLPVYTQPICPAPGYLWVPGYWAYGPDGYYWVPGAWVEPPTVGLLWTPGYWAFTGSFYRWNAGYWGPQVGFYGGINYGFGYTGFGYSGGYWRGNDFYYNRAVTNVNVNVVHNTYNTSVRTNNNHVSFNGGRGGVNARPTATQEQAARDRHLAATGAQQHLESTARANRNQFASVNHGRPAVTATAKPAAFKSSRTGTRERTTTKPAETKPRAERRSEAKPRTETKSPAATHERTTESKPRTETRSAATREAKTEPKPRTETRSSTREPKSEPKPRTESKPAATHEPKPAPKPKPEKSATTHEPKSAPKQSKPQPEKSTASHESKPVQPHAGTPHEENPRKPS